MMVHPSSSTTAMSHLGTSPTTPSFPSTTSTTTAIITHSSTTAESALDPTTRSRTLLFLSYRDSRAPRSRFAPSSRSRYLFDADEEDDDDSSENAGLLRGKGKSSKPTAAALDVESGPYVRDGSDALPPVWVDISDKVEEILKGTRTKIATLDKLHARHALPGFADRTAEEKEIEMLTADITKDFRQSHNLIQRVKPEIPASGVHTFPPSDGRNDGASSTVPTAQAVLAAKNVQRGLAAKVQEMSVLLRKKQKVYMDKLQGHAIKNQDLLIASGAISSKGFDGMTAVEEDVEASRSQQLSAQRQQSSNIDVQARARELDEIAKSINALADLFKDLSSLVIEQGTILDSIEYNIERTGVAMEGAVHELNVAKGYQRSAGRRQCICLLLVLIVGAIIVLIFKPKRHGSSSSGTPPLSSELDLLQGGEERIRVMFRRE